MCAECFSPFTPTGLSTKYGNSCGDGRNTQKGKGEEIHTIMLVYHKKWNVFFASVDCATLISAHGVVGFVRTANVQK